MNKWLLLLAITSQFFGGMALADDPYGEALIEQCRQEAKNAGAENISDYVSECLDKKLEYDTSG